jgi:hypothetical protein
MFLYLNENNISKEFDKSYIFTTLYDSQGQITSYKDISNEESKIETEFKVQCNPDQLKGIEVIWDVIESCNVNCVIDLFSEFLVKLYLSISNSVSENIIA